MPFSAGAGRAVAPAASPAAAFPWRQAVGFGLGILQLAPEQFWRMTPRELACAIEARAGRWIAPLRRGEFAELMKRYPDGR